MKKFLSTLTLLLASLTAVLAQFTNSGYLKSGPGSTTSAGAIMQFVPDAANGFSRAVFSHNAFWGSDNLWHLGQVGANDAQAIFIPNKDGFQFIIHPNTGNVARTLTHSNFVAGTKMVIKGNGNVGIGSLNPSSKLTVAGQVYAKEVKVDLNVPGPDYVFNDDYKLKSLSDTEKYIRKHKHLPGIPSAGEMETNGIKLSEMNMKLLEKVEELTLHLIKLNTKVERLEKENEKLTKRLKE